jgi:ribonuclease HI
MDKNKQQSVITEEQALNIFTDGSSYSKPRRGGIGITFVYVDENGNEEIEDIPVYHSYTGATNNQMELEACITALNAAIKSEYLGRVRKIVVFSDSSYVVDNYQNALFSWSRNGWLTKDNNPVLNSELWKRLLKATKKTEKRVYFRWVKGHSKSEHNRRADKLAKASAKSALKKKPPNAVTVRRKKSPKQTEIGSVEMKGQRFLIHIITDEYLPTQKLYKFKYEVASTRSKYRGNVDQIYSNFPLRAGHEYRVTVNKNTKTPRILRLIEEVKKTE